MHSCEVLCPFVRLVEGLASCRRGILSMASQAAFKRAFNGRPLHALSRSYIAHIDNCPHSLSGW